MITIKEASVIAKKKDKSVQGQGATKDAFIFIPSDMPIDDKPHGVAVYKDSGKAVTLATYTKNGGDLSKVKGMGTIRKAPAKAPAKTKKK